MSDYLMRGGSGAAYASAAPPRRNRTRTAGAALKTIPAFPNAFPYNELLLDGKLIAKTRDWVWAHRGLTLLYTSTRVHGSIARIHEMNPKDYPKKALVGVGNLIDVRPLTKRESRKLYSQFNNLRNFRGVSGRVLARKGIFVHDYVSPLSIGFFFEEGSLKRFKEPVPFDWPTGPVKPIGIPISKVAAALRAVGIREINGTPI